MEAQLQELVQSLLYEGYALYPYTAEATKNASPTPFGIVYPPAYAERTRGAFGVLQVDCALEGSGAGLRAEVRFLQGLGDRHQAVPRRVELDGPGEEQFEWEPLRGRVLLSLEGGRALLRIENHTPLPETAADRAEALQHALLSTHVVLRCDEGRFISQLEARGDNINSWPVLARADDRAVLGAAIVLPDHPQLASQSHGSLFDGTEIEEALLLHVQALSDGERDSITEHDPVVREMIERAATATPEDLFRLHGVMQPAEPANQPGEPEVEVDGRTFTRGGKVVLRLGRGGDPHDAMLDGRLATIERIYTDYDDVVHLAVTVDDDPGRDVMRSSGRYLFFKPDEVELR
jgi:hypothetical protein